jgi:hypothetical protein
MASLTRAEKKFIGLAEDAGLNYFLPGAMTTRKIVTEHGAGDSAQITYSFSHGTRVNKFAQKNGGIGEYGKGGMSFRLLYEFLCETFNGGEYFIDTYFSAIFDTRPVFTKLSTLNDTIISDIEEERSELEEDLVLKSDGTPDMRYAAGKRYASLSVWNNPERARMSTEAARDIQEDIIQCLASGRIPLRKQSVSASTQKKRERFIGMSGTNFFYASGQLIRHLNIFVALKEE